MRTASLFCTALLVAVCHVPAAHGIDDLGLCRVLTQEERDLLKRYPIICVALDAVNRIRPSLGHPPVSRCGPLMNITHALLDVGDKEAAKVTLRLTHKAFVEAPFMSQPDLFFSRLTAPYNGNRANFPVPFTYDELFPQEFLDDLINRCNDDFSDRMYHDGHFDGNVRFRQALRSVIGGMARSPGRMRTDSELERLNRALLEKTLNFITRIPNNQTCEGMRKELFLQAFRYILAAKVSPLVDALTDPEIKKEFSAYLEELETVQRQISMMDTLSLGRNLNEPPSREELQKLVESTEEPFERCTAMLTLAAHDLEGGDMEQAVKQLRDMEEFFAANKEKLRVKSMRGIEPFYSTLATTLVKNKHYKQGIDYLLEGAGKFADGLYCAWSTYSHRTPFILPPLRELHTAVQDEPVRNIVRQKLKTTLETVKDYKDVPQSQQLRAVLEMQIVLGFEEDAIPALKTTKFVTRNESELHPAPLWDGMTVAQFQLRCGLIDEAIATYSAITFRDVDPSRGHRPPYATDRTIFLQELLYIALAQKAFNHAEKIIELVREETMKPSMFITLARAYLQSGDAETALKIVLDVSHPEGYRELLANLLADAANREQNAKYIETLRDKYLEAIKKTEDAQSRYGEYSEIIRLLYWNDQRASAMKIIEEVDSPYHAAWIALTIAMEHEQPRRTEMARELNPRTYPDYYTEEQLTAWEYNSPHHFLNLTSAIKSAANILEPITRQREANTAIAAGERPQPIPFQPDRTAMKTLLDSAAALIAKENNPLHRANTLGAIGLMEYIYLSEEDAEKRFDAALEIMKSEKVAPNFPAVLQLPALFWELGEKEKARESVMIALLGNDPEKQADPKQARFERNTNVPLFETLAQCGEAALAYEMFLQFCNRYHDDGMTRNFATLQVIALYHDRQHPAVPLLPRAQADYRRLFGVQMMTGIDSAGTKLLRWSEGEKRIKSVQAAMENEVAPAGIAERHIQRRRLGYANSLAEFGNPFYRMPRIH